MIKDANLKFFKGLNPSNSKNFWTVAKYLTKQTSSIPILKDCHEQAIHDDAAKATLLNDFFSGCFNDAQPPLSIPELLLYGQPLERVTEYEYLGVILSANLSWSPHIEKLVTTTRRMIGMLYRQFYQWSDPEALIRLYISLIRPHLEYAAPVWSPEHMHDGHQQT